MSSEGKLQSQLWRIITENMPTIMAMFSIIFSVALYIFKIEVLERALAAHDSQQNNETAVQQEIIRKLDVLEVKLNYNTEGIDEVKKDLKDVQKSIK